MASYIGTATSRVDGIAKVTGAAKYAAEFNVLDLAHGSIVCAPITKGRIVHIDTRDAERVAGVITVLTHENRPPMAERDEAYKDDVAPEGAPYRPLYDDRVLFNGQPVALVIAENSESATFAATLVKVTYDTAPYTTDMFSQRDAAVPVSPSSDAAPPKNRGTPDQAWAEAAIRHEAEYFVPIEHHNPMELYASTVIYEDGGRLTVYDKTQGVQNVHRYLCTVFDMKPDDIRVMGAFMGGGFGSGLRPQFQLVLAVLAARALKRAVRVVLTRAQMYALGYRPAMIQHVALGANAGGTLDVIAHDAITITSQYETFHRQETGWSGLLYKSPHAKYAHRLARLDLATGADMRAPSAATALFALESAMDELALKLRLDPLELRLRCYSDRDQNEDKAYSSKNLHACYRQGADAFGWSRRNHQPRAMREDGDLIGWGMATGVWEALQVPITVRITLGANGHAEVACATSDIGTGTYTIMAQVAADMLGLPIENVSIKLGDSRLPSSPVEGGSWIATSVANAIVTTANAIRDDLLRMAQQTSGSSFAHASNDDVALKDGKLVHKGNGAHPISLADAMRQGGVDRLEQEVTTHPTNDHARANNTHAAHFVEVKVDEQLGVVRVTRAVSAIAAGRILNPKTASSQILGGVVWGIGMALHEETHIDHRFGRIMNANIAEYHVPVNADIPAIEVIFVDEVEPTNPLGLKGVGEIGIVGVAAAVANAVHHATGKRVRDLPITLDKVFS